MTDDESPAIASRVGPVEVDWPRAVGYYGGIGLAVTLGMIELPVGVFIAAVPFFKMLSRPTAPQIERTIGQVFEGAAKPVGGDASAVIQVAQSGPGQSANSGSVGNQAMAGVKGIWAEAQSLAR